ncbi:MAG: hypothetical protein KGZ63_11480 [Clostridiales bacterium]|jgi:hypothetical protein|nr:hypothetical protein [Clostridiales bacterium]
MPQIWRIRLSNIQYEKGKKVINDEIFQTHGENTLIQLTNGGGKTLSIQLVMQVVLPNVELNKRKLVELLHQKYTGHILVEWKLDNVSDDFLLTGFCFARGNNENGSLKYFMYTIQYQSLNELDIMNLPLRGEQGYISYQELNEFLNEQRKRMDVQVKIYDRDSKRSDYLRDLESFHLYEKEWKNIRNTNTKEGGVDEFFKSVESTVQLFDKYIISSVEEVVFGGKEEAESLASIFQEHQNKLCQIPEIEKQLQAFGSLEKGGETIVGEVLALSTVDDEYLVQKSQARLLHNRIVTEQQMLREQIYTAKEDLHGFANNLSELQYQSASIPYAELKEKEKAALELREVLHSKINEATITQNRLGEQLRQMNASNLWFDIQLLKGDIAEANKGIEVESKENKLEVLYNELDVYRATLHERLKEQKDGYTKQFKAATSLHNRYNTARRKCEPLISRMQNEVGILSNEITHLKNDLQTISNKGVELFDEYQSIEWIDNPNTAIAHFIKEASRIHSEKQRIVQRLTQIEHEKVEHQTRMFALTSKLATAIQEQTQKNKEHQDYMEQLSTMQGKLGHHELYSKDIFEDQGRLFASLEHKKSEFYTRYDRFSAEKQLLSDQLELLSEGHYIPNRNIIQLKELLESTGAVVITGSEWLSRMQIDGTRKEQLLRSQPLLPYAVVISEADFKKIKAQVSLWRRVTMMASPVPIIVYGEHLQSQVDSEDHSLLAVNQSTYLAWHKGYQCTLSTEALADAQQELQENIFSKENQLEKLQDSIQQVTATQAILTTFYGHYTSNTLPDLTAAIERLTADISAYKQEWETHERDINAILYEQEQLQGKNEEFVTAQKQAEQSSKRFKEWAQDLLTEKIAKGEKRTKESRHAVLEKTVAKMIVNRDRMNDKLEQIKEVTVRTEQLILETEKEQAKYPYPVKAVSSLSIGLAQAITGYVQREAAINKVDSRIEMYNDRIRMCEKRIQEKIEEIAELQIPYDMIQPIHLAYPRNELSQVKKYERDVSATVKALELEWQAADKEVAKLGSNIQLILERIAQEYEGRRPYAFSALGLAKERLPLLLAKAEDDKTQKQAEIGTLTELSNQYELGSVRLDASLSDYSIMDAIGALPDEEWLTIKDTLVPYIVSIQSRLKEISGRFTTKRAEVDKAYEGFSRTLQSEGNQKLKTLVDMLHATDKRYQKEYVTEMFSEVFARIKMLRERAESQKETCEREKHELVRRCELHARRLAEEIGSIDKCMMIEYGGRSQKALQINLKERMQQPSLELMAQYVNECVETLKDKADNGESEEKQEQYIRQCMTSRQLLNVLYNVKDSTIRLLKPEEYPGQSPQYDPWEDVHKWSGGEGYAGCMAVFMAILSYTRSQICGLRNPHKVLLADNLFGKASAAHILDYIFQLASNNNIQLLCYTALTSGTIYRYFPVVYSLKLRKIYDREYIHTLLAKDEVLNIEAGNYDITVLEQELEEMRQSKQD